MRFLEVTWKEECQPQNAWADEAPEVEFMVDASGKTTRVRGFYDGNGLYKARLLTEETGSIHWQVCNRGQVSECKTEECFITHGPVRTRGIHFAYDDGCRFIPFGTTVYALIHQPKALIKETLQTLAASAFNKVRYCVFPKYYSYNRTDPEFYPFEKKSDGSWDTGRPVSAFWHNLEAVLKELQKMEIQSDLILFHPYDNWGFSKLTRDERLQYLDYLLRRLSAFPSVWWSLANEYDLLFHLGDQDWYEIENYVAEHDPYRHLLSCHQCVVPYDNSRNNISHFSLQIREPYRVPEFREMCSKPIIFDELGYEGRLSFDWGNLSAFAVANRFWAMYVQGAYASHGEVLPDPGKEGDDEEILWWGKGGRLKGESPKRIAWLKDFLQEAGGSFDPWNLLEYSKTKPQSSEEILMNASPDNALVKFYQREQDPRKREVYIEPVYAGRRGDECFVRYFADTCPGYATIYLPEHAEYSVEVLDIWEMTKETVLYKVSGEVFVRLPGKPGICVCCMRVKSPDYD